LIVVVGGGITTIMHRPMLRILNWWYIESCGGFSPRANRQKVLLVKKEWKGLNLQLYIVVG